MLRLCTSVYQSPQVMAVAQWRQQGAMAEVTAMGATRHGRASSGGVASMPLLMGGMTAECERGDVKSRWMQICVARRELVCEAAILATIAPL